jgi:hypothetical protein
LKHYYIDVASSDEGENDKYIRVQGKREKGRKEKENFENSIYNIITHPD